jgi:very-short-patch-repair endonuclease
MSDSAIPSPLAGEGSSRDSVGGRGGIPTQDVLLARAKSMRSNPTEAERVLWQMLRAKRLVEYKFKRQVVIDWYIADFDNFERRLIIEADGSQHDSNAHDERRDAYLTAQGFRMLRFWNTDILLERQSIGDAIWHALQQPPLPPTAARRVPPSPARGEGFLGATGL